MPTGEELVHIGQQANRHNRIIVSFERVSHTVLVEDSHHVVFKGTDYHAGVGGDPVGGNLPVGFKADLVCYLPS